MSVNPPLFIRITCSCHPHSCCPLLYLQRALSVRIPSDPFIPCKLISTSSYRVSITSQPCFPYLLCNVDHLKSFDLFIPCLTGNPSLFLILTPFHRSLAFLPSLQCLPLQFFRPYLRMSCHFFLLITCPFSLWHFVVSPRNFTFSNLTCLVFPLGSHVTPTVCLPKPINSPKFLRWLQHQTWGDRRPLEPNTFGQTVAFPELKQQEWPYQSCGVCRENERKTRCDLLHGGKFKGGGKI